MSRTVDDIIEQAGGARAIATASEKTDHPVGFDAVYKWPKSGIPQWHWPLLQALTKLKIQDFYEANRAVERSTRRKRASAERCVA
jgi:hypothetical protein